MRKSIQNIIFAKSKEWLIEKIHRSSEGGYGEVLCDTDRVRWRQIIRCLCLLSSSLSSPHQLFSCLELPFVMLYYWTWFYRITLLSKAYVFVVFCWAFGP